MFWVGAADSEAYLISRVKSPGYRLVIQGFSFITCFQAQSRLDRIKKGGCLTTNLLLNSNQISLI